MRNSQYSSQTVAREGNTELVDKGGMWCRCCCRWHRCLQSCISESRAYGGRSSQAMVSAVRCRSLPESPCAVWQSPRDSRAPLTCKHRAMCITPEGSGPWGSLRGGDLQPLPAPTQPQIAPPPLSLAETEVQNRGTKES